MEQRRGVAGLNRTPGGWGLKSSGLFVALLAVFGLGSNGAVAATAHKIDVSIAAGALPASDAGEQAQVELSALPAGAPAVNAESQITGPVWVWSITATQWLDPTAGTFVDSSYFTDSIDAPDPSVSNAVLNATFKRAGTWKVSLKVTVDYSDPMSGDTWHGENTADVSGSASLNAILQVQRSTMGNGYGGSTIVAAGAQSPLEHFADVQITAKDSKGNAMSGVYVDAPTMKGADGVDVKGTFAMPAGVTDGNGHLTAPKAFYSSDVTTDAPILTLKDSSGATISTATIAQDWDDIGDGSDWSYDDFFDVGDPSSVTFSPQLVDGKTQVPITGHTMEFKLTAVTGTIVDPVSGEETHYAYQNSNPTGANYLADLSAYGTFDPEAVSGGGDYSSDLTVTDDTVDTVNFDATDDNVYLN